MEDGEGGLSFDFEGGLDPGTTQSTAPASAGQSSTVPTAASGAVSNANNKQAASAPAAQAADGTGEGRRNFRQTVCRHWLRSLCMKGDACGFLHQYDKARMPVCRFFRLYGECRQKDCMYKHTIDDIKECNMYKLGFCPNGPDCRYRHAKLPGPPPPVEEVLQKIQHFTSHNYGNSNRYFIAKSCNRDNLELSVQQRVWATQRSNEAKLNEAFDSVENIILIFPINKTRHFQGCAKMTSRNGGSIGGGNWKHEHGSAHYGRNFAVKWLKLCELSFHKTLHLRNPYNENLPVKISRDCQELEPSVGEQLAFMLYLEPDSDLMAISLAAESKREEEKAKGVNPENPAIVPFEDNVEEEEESCGQVFRAGAQGRGRGRGIMWPPHMPFAHVA
ncbi:30-kDa cleavage and polyadenylation specificity factor 30 [Forsythia ovata]|uniref:30-kDa cleavage and polyadenylation specificity factor 30 n=1 Tax=Forsythia ovata TaxID=205694 RepID=A0ABD1R978_9LAMI